MNRRRFLRLAAWSAAGVAISGSSYSGCSSGEKKKPKSKTTEANTRDRRWRCVNDGGLFGSKAAAMAHVRAVQKRTGNVHTVVPVG